jgi:hemerythrin-like metal-binding protein
LTFEGLGPVGSTANAGKQYEYLRDELAMGIDTIDRDHDQLFFLCDLFRKSGDDANLNILRTVVIGLVEFMTYHFSKEEIGFQICGFKGAIDHEQEHAEFEQKVFQILEDLGEHHGLIDATKLRELSDFRPSGLVLPVSAQR